MNNSFTCRRYYILHLKVFFSMNYFMRKQICTLFVFKRFNSIQFKLHIIRNPYKNNCFPIRLITLKPFHTQEQQF